METSFIFVATESFTNIQSPSTKQQNSTLKSAHGIPEAPNVSIDLVALQSKESSHLANVCQVNLYGWIAMGQWDVQRWQNGLKRGGCKVSWLAFSEQKILHNKVQLELYINELYYHLLEADKG